VNAWQTFLVALRALARNKMRSFLTTLGVIIGVGALIVVVAIGEGAKKTVEQAFASIGTNLLIVMSGSTSAGGLRGGAGSQPSLTWDDLKAIQNEVPSVKLAAPFLRANTSIVSEDQNWTTQVSGTTGDYLEIRDWGVSSGRSFTPSDVEAQTKVVLLGRTVADKLFGPGSDPVGQAVRVSNIPFDVVGVLVAKGQSPNGQDYDDAAFIPVTTFRSKIQGGLGNFIPGVIFVQAASPSEVARAEAGIAALLRDRHHARDGADDDFSIRNLAEIAGAQEQGTQTVTTLLSSVAAVSLLVGGIGIMNIMLVSVTERTREIGLRMAVGAKPQHILGQFLVEALALSVMGGGIGVVLGAGVAMRLAATFGWPIVIRPDVVLIAVLFSAAVGIGFGLYPAQKASRLDPITALRYE
jgi:putative ABC transport system permease protein